MCDYFDATVFQDISIELAESLMDKFGIKNQGYRYLYNGETGERIKTQIFMVPTNYYRLQKFSVTAKYAVNQSSINI